MRGFSRPRDKRDAVEENVPQYCRDNHHASTRAATRDLRIRNHVNVWHVSKDNHLHPYDFQKVQDLLPTDYLPHCSCSARTWWPNRNRNIKKMKYVLVTDEACFTRTLITSTTGNRITSMHVVHRINFQHQFSVNVWAVLLGDISCWFLRVKRFMNRFYVCEVIPEMLEDAPLGIHRRMWFHHGTFPSNARNYLNIAFPDMRIRRHRPVAWPPRSPEMTPLDSFSGAAWSH